MERLDELCERVADLREAPDDVMALARLRATAAAGAVRAGAALSGLSMGEGAEAWASHLARVAWDDPVLGGRTGLAGPAVALEGTRDLREMLLCGVVADEVGGRVGLLGLRGEHGAGVDLLPAACGAAAAEAWRAGAGAGGIRAAILRAANVARRYDAARWGEAPEEAGREAVRAARSRVDSDGALETALAARTTTPAWGALAGVGAVWLTRTLWLRRFPGPCFGATALEALDEILRRNVKAADKRLRVDQIESIELRVAQPAWLEAGGGCEGAGGPRCGAGSALVSLAGVLVARHSLTGDDLSARGQPEPDAVAERITVDHGWPLTVAALGSLGGALGPLLGGGRGALGLAGDVRTRAQWPCLGRADVLPLLRARPDRLFSGWVRGAGDLLACDVECWRWSQPVEVALHTTRGGRWPERRAVPAGTGDDGPLSRESVARARHPRAEELLSLPLDAPASRWREVALG